MPAATKIQRREFLQLADTYEPAKHKVAGYYISEQLDGTRGFCAGDEPDERFNQISYAVYSSPSFGSVFANGLIKNSNMHVEMGLAVIERFVRNRLPRFKGDFKYSPAGSTFDQELLFLRDAIEA